MIFQVVSLAIVVLAASTPSDVSEPWLAMVVMLRSYVPGLVAAVELVKATLLSVALPMAENRPAISLKLALMALSSLLESRARLPSFWKEIPTWLRVLMPLFKPVIGAPSCLRSWLWIDCTVESPSKTPPFLVSGL